MVFSVLVHEDSKMGVFEAKTLFYKQLQHYPLTLLLLHRVQSKP